MVEIKTKLTDEQIKLVEAFALALKKNDEFSAAILLTKLKGQGLRIESGIENKETTSISTEQ